MSDEYDGDDVTEEALNKFLPEVRDELYYELISWPEPETREHLLSVLVEEVGEVARAVNDKNGKAYHDELIQVAAVALSMLWKYDEEAKKE